MEQPSKQTKLLLSKLSDQEYEIFCMLATGNNTSEIAKRMSLSYKLVADCSMQIKSKLNITTIAELKRLYHQSA